MIVRPRVYISAAHKSSGKTTISIGLCAALARQGMVISPFKKGPDYIDPMWLGRASGRACYNLDFNTQSNREINSLFCEKSSVDGISIIEGNKGLYDGVDVSGSDSNAAMAKQLAAPVVLVLDVTGITRGVAPLVLGYQAFDRDVRIAGVILNKVGSARVESKLRAVLEEYTDIPVLGSVGRDPRLEVRERHLGLTPPGEVGEIDRKIDALCAMAEASVDLDKIISIGGSASPLAVPKPKVQEDPGEVEISSPVRIGVARDAAFGFYYGDDLEALEAQGAELVFFDTLKDGLLPEVDGLFIGGGFPETQMAKLSANKGLMKEIAQTAKKGMPIYAECGGLMYLTRSIRWGDLLYEMVGIIEADTVMDARPQGRGLVVLEETDKHPWGLGCDPGDRPAHRSGRFGAHEFHYARLENTEPGLEFAYQIHRGTGIDGVGDGIIWKNVLANFSHLRNTDQLNWVKAFISFVRKCKMRGA